MTTTFASPDVGAIISDCGLYRYRLWRVWDYTRPLMAWIMLNPSTADALLDDPTIRKCVGFARRHECGGIYVVNLFALRSTDPKALLKAKQPLGLHNDAHVREVVAMPRVQFVVGGWGSNKFAQARARQVVQLVKAEGRSLHCFFRTADGAPGHPLYLPYESLMVNL